MTLPETQALQDALKATWPAHLLDPFLLCNEGGNGNRASVVPTQANDADQNPLWGGSPHDVGSVSLYVLPLVDLQMDRPAPTASFHIWEPLAIQAEIWAAGGIGPECITLMQRASCPKTALLGRREGHAVAAGFAAIHNAIVMIHALEVMPTHRRHGTARALMLEAARWATPLGALHIAIACADANGAAKALCGAVGLHCAGRYHAQRHLGKAAVT